MNNIKYVNVENPERLITNKKFRKEIFNFVSQYKEIYKFENSKYYIEFAVNSRPNINSAMSVDDIESERDCDYLKICKKVKIKSVK